MKKLPPEAVRFLRALVGGARRQERVPAHVGRLVDREGAADLAALGAGDGTRRARVENPDPHVRLDRFQPLAKRRGTTGGRCRARGLSRRRAPSSRRTPRCGRCRRPGRTGARQGRAPSAPSSAASSSPTRGCLRRTTSAASTPPSACITWLKRSASVRAYFRSGRSSPPRLAAAMSTTRRTVVWAGGDCGGAAVRAVANSGGRHTGDHRWSLFNGNRNCVKARGQGERCRGSGCRLAAASRMARRTGSSSNGASAVTK